MNIKPRPIEERIVQAAKWHLKQIPSNGLRRLSAGTRAKEFAKTPLADQMQNYTNTNKHTQRQSA